MKEDIKRLKPTLVFLARFLGLYLMSSLLYGIFVNSYGTRPDPITKSVTTQTAIALRLTGHDVETKDNPKKPTTAIRMENISIVSVYEGCNGVNIAIVFTAFLFAFGPFKRTWLPFTLLGLLVIHLANISRIAALFLITLYKPDLSYFTHKYLFTAFIYAVVFALWLLWVKRISFKPQYEE